MFGGRPQAPPAIAVRNTEPSRAVTTEYGIQIHTGAEAYPLEVGSI